MNPKESLKKLRAEQRKLLGRRKDFEADINGIDSDIAELESEAVKVRSQIAQEETKDLVKNLKAVAGELRQGTLSGLWKEVQGNLAVLRDNDPLFFNQAEARLKDVGGFSDDEKRFLVSLVGNCLHKVDDLAEFLAWIGGKNKAGNFFFEGGEQ